MKKDIVIVGAGPAGLAAAIAAYDAGVTDILILERDKRQGGILNQCIHNGFGLHTFKEELTGPEYAARYMQMASERRIECMLEAMVVDIQGGDKRTVTVMSREKGMFQIEAGAVILAMGCRERPRGAMNIPGYRPAGVYSAGTAQYYVNMEGQMPGREVVVLGSGDIGLIMARRMTLQGARVKLVAEIMPYSGGLKRNIVQCLDDFGIPLKLSHTVITIHGKERVTGVTLARVDENLKPIPGTEEEISCDTVLLSCGLIPENELSEAAGAQMDPVTAGPVVNARLETTVPGVFACGNVLHVHDLADHVSGEAKQAGEHAAAFVTAGDTKWGEAVRPRLPEKTKCTLPEGRDSRNQLICIGCPVGCLITVVKEEDGTLLITGNTCNRGAEYARKEMTAPARIVTSFVRVTGAQDPVLSVKTATDIPKGKIEEAMEQIRRTVVKAPVHIGDVVVSDVAGTGVDVNATREG